MNAIPSLLTDHLDIWTSAQTEKKSGRGRSGNGASVYGIQKLRELILELAVRGKLVPQDPNDEPAGELLKRIQAEKAKLVAEGKIKKEKPLPPISDEDKPFELPLGWEWVRFPDVYFFQEGPGIRNWQFRSEGIKLLNVQNIVNGELVLSNSDKYIDSEEYNKKYLHFTIEKNDLLFASSGGSWGKTAFFTDPGFKVIVNTSTVRIHPYSDFCSRFFMRNFVDSLLFKNQMVVQLVGMQPNFGSTHLSKIFMALPPSKEQRRIVTKVDELMALCDQLETQHINAAEAHEKLVSHLLGTLTQSQNADDFSANWQRIAAHFDTLFTTETSIDALKQTLLQLAVMGKLVPQDPNDEPASELLKRIQAEKAKLVAEGKIKKDKPLPPISNEEKPFELPQGWEWIRVSELLSKIGAGSTPLGGKQVYVNSGIPFIRSQNVWDDGLRLDDVAFITSEIHQKMSSTHVYAGDLLFNITGASIGRCAIVPDSFETGNVSQHVTIIRLVFKEILLFLHLVLISKHVQQTVMDVQVGVSREGLSIGKLGQFIIPIPPLPEQHRIVTKVDELMVLCDQLKSAIARANQLQKKLAGVVVEQAIAS